MDLRRLAGTETWPRSVTMVSFISEYYHVLSSCQVGGDSEFRSFSERTEKEVSGARIPFSISVLRNSVLCQFSGCFLGRITKSPAGSRMGFRIG